MGAHTLPTGMTKGDLSLVVRCPRDSDGIGNALRQVFDKQAAVPNEFSRLLGRLDRTD